MNFGMLDLLYQLMKRGQRDIIASYNSNEIEEVNPYLMNRFLASNPILLPIVAKHENNTVRLHKKAYLIVMYELLPKGFFELKFSTKELKDAVKEELISKIKKYYICDTNTALEYYDILMETEQVNDFLLSYKVEY